MRRMKTDTHNKTTTKPHQNKAKKQCSKIEAKVQQKTAEFISDVIVDKSRKTVRQNGDKTATKYGGEIGTKLGQNWDKMKGFFL